MKSNTSINIGQAKQRVNKTASFQTPSINMNSPPNVMPFHMETMVPVKGEASIFGKYTMPPGIVRGAAAKFAQTGASFIPHQFALPVVNQNGVADPMSLSQSFDLPTNLALTSEENKSSHQQQQQNLANTKEKNPLCLINELARYNKVTHQYTLVDEQGPAHNKTFLIKLQLGDNEEFSASGASIKKAQHAAAAIALEKTSFRCAPPKPLRRPNEVHSKFEDGISVTPTVELNALAIKRGEPAIYRVLDTHNIMSVYYQQHNYDFRGMYNQRYHTFMQPPVRISYVSLKVGNREFIGEGVTHQQARHNAARKALNILRSLQTPDGSGDNKSITTAANNENQTSEATDDKSKSEISLVHEIAQCHNFPVSFDVIRESGPPHMKIYVTQCVVGNFKTEAEGTSKRLSKRRAAELMLKELKILPPLPPSSTRPKNKPVVNKKKNQNLIKMQKADPTYGVGINPVSRLIQIQQAQKKLEPVYTLLAERGLPRRREFVMQVQVEEHTCSGVASNKKLAKRYAAEAMLELLGFNKPSPQPVKPAIKMQGDASSSEKKVTFSDITEKQGRAVMNGRQMIPGLIVLPEGKQNTYSQLKAMQSQFTGGRMVSVKMSGMRQRPENKLREICDRINIDIMFDEFAGASNPNEFLSRLHIASNPPHTLHGSGTTPEAARDSASEAALRILFEAGAYKEESPTDMAAIDGTQAKDKL